MLGPYPVEKVIERLALVSALRIVGGVADFETAKTTPPNNSPAAYVLGEETGQRLGDYSSQLRQRLAVVVKVVLWVRHAGDAATGSKAVAAMTALEADVRSALFGFAPSASNFEPLAIKASGADQYYGNHLIRQVLFESNYVIESTA